MVKPTLLFALSLVKAFCSNAKEHVMSRVKTL
jgi:hypothetical protein